MTQMILAHGRKCGVVNSPIVSWGGNFTADR